MKKIFAIVAVTILASSAAVAGGTNTSNTSGAIAGASNAGNAQTITFVQEAAKPVEQRELTRTITDFNQNYSGSYDIKNVPAFAAPALTSSNDTCMGSTSIGGAGVGFGISIGSSWTDDNCVMLKNSRELYNMGMKGAAMARMCMDDKNKEALELTGFVCPQTKKEQDAAKAEAAKTASN